MAERFTRIDPRTEFALVAAEPLPPGEALVGAVARVAIDERSHDAEFAILVSRYIANMGLGRYLMTRLVKWARARRSIASMARCSSTTPDAVAGAIARLRARVPGTGFAGSDPGRAGSALKAARAAEQQAAERKIGDTIRPTTATNPERPQGANRRRRRTVRCIVPVRR